MSGSREELAHARALGGGPTPRTPEQRAPNVACLLTSAECRSPEPCRVIGILTTALRDELRKDGRLQAREDARVGDGTGSQVGVLVEEALALVRPLLPCDRCPQVEVVIARLGRLGKLARRVFLGAPAPTGDAVVVEPLHPGRPAAVAHRRAMHQLARAGLVSLSTSADGRLAVRRSPLGQAVVERLEGVLTQGKRIRWSRHRQGLLAAVRRPIPELLDDLRRSVAEAKRAHLELIALLAAFRRPADPLPPEDRAIHLLDLVLTALATANGGPRD